MEPVGLSSNLVSLRAAASIWFEVGGIVDPGKNRFFQANFRKKLFFSGNLNKIDFPGKNWPFKAVVHNLSQPRPLSDLLNPSGAKQVSRPKSQLLGSPNKHL